MGYAEPMKVKQLAWFTGREVAGNHERSEAFVNMQTENLVQMATQWSSNHPHQASARLSPSAPQACRAGQGLLEQAGRAPWRLWPT